MLVWVRHQVQREPGPARVEKRKDTSAHDGKDRHCLGKPGNARPPSLPEEKQNCRNQRTGVAYPNPENEVHNIKPPRHRLIDAPKAKPFINCEPNAERS